MALCPIPPGLKTLELNDQKSGMEGLEKEKINNIIYNASKGSKYFYHQQRRQQQIDYQIQQLTRNLEQLTEEQKQKAKQEMDELAVKLEQRRNVTRVIVHIDMDAFYAAVEMRDNPDYRDKPLAVGSSAMLSTSNYIARRFGVRAAMPGFIGKKLCPELIIVPPDFGKYTRVSQEVREILGEYDPDFMPMSLDEAYLDLTAYLKKKLGVPEDRTDVFDDDDEGNEYSYNGDSLSIFNLSDDIVNEMRHKIFEKTNLTASAGIAPNMMLAKICSDIKKPNGQFKISPNVEEIKNFIKSLPVRKVSGIGPVQEQLLCSLGFKTCEDLWQKRELLPLLFSPTSAQFYLRVSLGISSTRVRCESSRKSKGVEVTFQETSNIDALIDMCSNLSRELAGDLQAEKLLGKVVVLKIKTVKFEVKTRHHTLSYYTSRENNIFQAAKALLLTEIAAVKPELLSLRLMGVRMTGLVDEATNGVLLKQPTLSELLHKSDDSKDACPDGAKVGSRHDQSQLRNSNEGPGGEEGAKVSSGNHTVDIEMECISSHANLNYNPSDAECVSDVIGSESDNFNCSVEASNSGLSYVCPVCELCDTSWSLMTFNHHIDVCLNRATIKELVKSSFEIDTGKQKPDLQSPKRFKRRKLDFQCHTIEHYFK